MMSILFGVQSFECSAQRVSVATQQQRGRQLSHNPIEQQSRERYQALLDRTEQVLSELQQDQRLQGVGKVSYSKRALRFFAIAVVKIIEGTWGASKFLVKQTIKFAFKNPTLAVVFFSAIAVMIGQGESFGKFITNLTKTIESSSYEGAKTVASSVWNGLGWTGKVAVCGTAVYNVVAPVAKLFLAVKGLI